MKSIRIISRHNTLAEAVTAANPDLSYNRPLAAEYIRNADTPPPNAKAFGIGATERAYIVEGKKENPKSFMFTRRKASASRRRFRPSLAAFRIRPLRSMP